MRRWIVLGAALGVLGSCSGEEPEPRPDPEICDDEIDNDGDGLVDCDDSECGGLPCIQGDDDDDTGDTSVPPPPVEVQYDEESCCDFEFSTASCAQQVGTVSFINRTEDETGDFDISCDQLGGSFAFKFAESGQGAPAPFLSGRPIEPGEQITVDVFFECVANQTFTVDCNAKVEAGADEDIEDFSITGTRSE